jgi:mono/diheme cytochrome c family protein
MPSHISSTSKPLPGFVLALGGVIAVGVMAGGVWLAPQQASATPAYASQTGRACGACHVSKSGGGALTAFGKSFAANGHKVPGKGAPKGKSSSAAPGTTTVVTTAAPAFSERTYFPDTTGSPRLADYVLGTNPGIVFTGPSPAPVLYGGGLWNR